MNPVKHAGFERLADLAEGRLVGPELAAVQAHVESCGTCTTDLAWINRTVGIMRSSALEEPASEVVNRAVRLLRQPNPTPGIVSRILATLRFDSAQAPMQTAFGLRGVGPGSARQLLFAAADREIQLSLQPRGDGWSLAGQVLGTCAGGGQVELRGPDQLHATLSALCEFKLDGIPPGRYSLVIELEDLEVEVSDLAIG